MPCIFCGTERLTREHIYSRAWMELLAPQATNFTNSRAAGNRKAVPTNTWVSSEMDLVVRCVCSGCNSGWMNDLDLAAQKIVNALCRGEIGVKVVGDALRMFVTWAVKMAFAMECLLPETISPQALRDRFYAAPEPPTGVRVWVSTMEGWEGETQTTPMSLVSAPEAGEVEQAYLVTFRMLHLVVQVVVPLDERVRPEHDMWGKQHAEQAWPRRDPLEWPLPVERRLASVHDYYRLTESFGANEPLRIKSDRPEADTT